MINNLPQKTVERLSLYRRALVSISDEKENIHSHRLAHMLKINPAHVRRDLMLIGFQGDIHKGYDIKELIDYIGKAIDCNYTQKVAFVGIGEIGRQVERHFELSGTKLKVAATFKLEEDRTRNVDGVKCYSVSKMVTVIKKENVEILVLAVPPKEAQKIADKAIAAGIKGILNFSSVYLKAPKNIYIDNFDIVATVEKLAYFTNKEFCKTEGDELKKETK